MSAKNPINQEFPTSIFFDGDRDMSNNGLPATWPDGGTNRRWHRDDTINNALANSGWVGKGYYARSEYERKSLTTVYVQGFQKDNLLGIQYWFYYPFHDDPGLDPHPHDWWYFWVVYDVSAKKPVKVIYDFHHNLRACDFTDTRVHREGIHVFTYHDAGGHRVMYGRGLDVSDSTSLWIGYQISQGGRPLYNTFEHGGLYSSDGDYTIGLMVDLLSANGELAPWRGVWLYFYDPWSGEGRWELLADWNAGVTLKVEDFQHWVWVYGVEPYDENNDRVFFTGDLIYHGEKGDIWPRKSLVGSRNIETALPWRSGISYHNTIVVSSAEMVWWWRQYDPSFTEKNIGHYTWDTLGSPLIFTRYYDGSS